MPQPTITYRNSTTYQPYAPYIRLLFALLFSVIGTHVYAHTSIERHILAGDKVLGKQQLNLMHTNDGSNDIVTVPNECLDEFKHFAETYNTFGMKEAYDAIGWNDYWKSEFGLAEQQLSNEHIANMNMLNSDWSKQNAVAFWMNPTGWNATKYGVSEGLSQWTNPELVVAGLSAGVYGLQAVRSLGRVAAKGRSSMFGKTIQQTTTRMGRDGKAVEIIFKDGSKIDINAARVKQWIPKTHPKAPPGTLQKVKFPNSIPGTKGYKRLPTLQELDFLNDL